MWSNAPESKYHMLPIIMLAMHVVREKSSSNYEVKASLSAPPDVFLIVFLCGHFVA